MKFYKQIADAKFVLEYPKFFDTDGPGGVDKGPRQGSPAYAQAWAKALRKNPEAKVNAYFTSEEDMQALLDHPNFEDMWEAQGNTGRRIKDGNPEYGIGKYIQLKRKMNDTVEFVDRETGQDVEIDKGGLPEVVKPTEDPEAESAWVPWEIETDGILGNGTVARVKFEVYNKGATRLVKVGILEPVLYELTENTDQF